MNSLDYGVDIKPGEKLFLLGQATITVLTGQIHILGKYVSPEDGPLHVVSPPSTALLSMDNFTGQSSARVIVASLFNGLETLCLPNGTNALGLAPNAKVTYVLNPPNEYQLFDVPEEWWRLSSAFLSKTDGDLPPIILICGPRKVGKSTFGRFFVNQLLNRYPKVAHVDLDLGQTEFNPPGFISLKIIEEALLGPPLRHSGLTDHGYYLGSASVQDGPRHYFECSKSLVSKHRELYRPNGIPLVINTMGWVTGLGFLLLQQAIQTSRPTHIIAIKPNSPDMDNSVPEYVWDALYEKSEFRYSDCIPYTTDEVISVAAIGPAKSAGNESERTRAHPSELRNLVWLTYFFQDMSRATKCYDFSKPLSHLVPFQLSWRSAALLLPPSSDRPNIDSIIAQLSHAVVGLAPRSAVSGRQFTAKRSLRIHFADYGDSSIEIYGAAIIRGVDPHKQIFEILTPIPLADLNEKSLFTIVFRPGFYFPRPLIVDGHQDMQNVPYFSTASSFSGSVPNVRKVRTNIKRHWMPDSLESRPMTEDPELAAIRARRLAEMQDGASGGIAEADARRKREPGQLQQEEQLRHSILARILTGEARERLSRVSMVKPERARAMEDFIINAARAGQLRGTAPQGQLTEKDLVNVLEHLEEQEGGSETKIKYQRRDMLDEDEDF